MHQLAERILNLVVYSTDKNGKTEKIRVKGSSISIPVINKEQTKELMENIVHEYIANNDIDNLIIDLKESINSVKTSYELSHTGFRFSKSYKNNRHVKLDDMYAFSIAAAYCFELIPSRTAKNAPSIGIGVMAPAIQDCGKNLIRLTWISAGYNVFDLGNTVHPDTWIKEIHQNKLVAVGISCMTSKSCENLKSLLGILATNKSDISVIIGGIATNRVTAYELTQKFGIPVYYGQDLNDAQTTLQKALAKSQQETPLINKVETIRLPSDLLPLELRHGFQLFNIPITNIIVNDGARNGCASCSGNKLMLCPLQIGYAQQKSIHESRAYIDSFKFAVIAIADFPNEEDIAQCKSLWKALLRVEQHFNSTYNYAIAFKFPMTCPFCRPKDCTLSAGKCMFPSHYRLLHEEFSINMKETLSKVFGDAMPTGIISIILVR